MQQAGVEISVPYLFRLEWKFPYLTYSTLSGNFRTFSLPGLNDKEKLARQKQLLNKRLGLDKAGGIGFTTDDLYKEEDLLLVRDNGAAATELEQNRVSKCIGP